MIEIIKSDEFIKWLTSLKDKKAQKIIFARLIYIEKGNLGDVKPVGGGVSEIRIHCGAGYRLYFIQKGSKLIIMLGEGDKSSQTRDINKAKELANYWR